VEISVILLPFALGILSFASPCVAPLLPGYFSYLLQARGGGKLLSRVLLGLLCSLGVMVSMSIIGGAIAVLGEFTEASLAIVTRAASFAIMALGAILLSGRDLAFTRGVQVRREGYLGGFIFGLLFGPVILPCCLPLIAAAFLYAFTFAEALIRFLAVIFYGLGLAVPLTVVAIAATASRGVLVRVASSKLVKRGSGAVLIVIGISVLLRSL